MRFEEAEDFEVWQSGTSLGRYMVESTAPYYVDIDEEIGDADAYTEIRDVLNRLLDEGRISVYKPNYKVEVTMFDGIKYAPSWNNYDSF